MPKKRPRGKKRASSQPAAERATLTHKRSRKPPTSEDGKSEQSSKRLEQRFDRSDEEHAAPAEFPIVGIGASAGGLAALKRFFDAMPAEPGMAFVVIQHLDPTKPSMTAELLATHTRMRVCEVADEPEIAPNRIYVIPPGKYLSISRGMFELSEPDRPRGSRMAIDFFLRSLAEDRQRFAIAVILSGTGADGSLGIKAIKARGGLIVVQAPETAEYSGMPDSAIGTGVTDYVLPIDEMPEALINYARHPYLTADETAEPVKGERTDLSAILALLKTRTKYDFSCYKSSTLLRRTWRRLGLLHLEDMSQYLEYLRDHAEEFELLVKDLLISVTDFFREPEAWQALDESVIAPLVERKSPDEPIRVWVPGCATGEEPYSVAMLILERLKQARKSCPVQVFASDVDRHALERARHGIYPKSIVEDVSPERLKRFFLGVKDDRHFQVTKTVREIVVFADQNLVSDPPFSKLDLICCRNVLIYLKPDIQQKIIALFHFALVEGGVLFLGNSETIGRHEDLFKPVVSKWRIYRRIGRTRHDKVEFPVAGPIRHEIGPVSAPMQRREHRLAHLAQQRLLDWIAPSAVLIDRNWKILYFCGDTDDYLTHQPGTPSQDLLAKLRQGLRTKVRGAVQKALDSRETVVVSARVKRGGRFQLVQITARPIRDPEQEKALALVIFEPAALDGPMEADASGASAGHRGRGAQKVEPAEISNEDVVRHLEDELATTKDDLHTTIEQLESSNEEYKAANEEAMSINEELQSTNEELETSKEELQSLNEELNTVNSQLALKVEELESKNNDLKNLLSSTGIATICLDRQLRIKWFTPATTRLMKLVPSDVGRLLTDFAHTFANEDLPRDARHVLERLGPIEGEVVTTDERYYLRRIVPYRTVDDRIDGVVVTFVDISDRKRYENSLLEAKELSETIVDTVREAMLVLDSNLRVVSANDTFYREFQLSPEETAGEVVYDLDSRQWDIPQLHQLLDKVLSQDSPNYELEAEHTFQSIGRRTLHLHAHRIAELNLILLAIQDVTEQRRVEQGLRLLADASVILARLDDYRTTLRELARSAVPAFADWCHVDLVQTDGPWRQLAAIHADPQKTPLIEYLGKHYPENPDATGGVMEVLRTRQPKIIEELSADQVADMAADEEQRRIIRQLSPRSYMCVPLRSQGEILGTMTYVCAESGRRYTSRDLAFAEELALRAEIAVDNARLYQEVRDAGRRKDEFLAMLAHELRNPLTPIHSGLELLAHGAENPQKTIDLMQQQVKHLVRLVDDLLDVSRIVRGKITLHPESIQVATLVKRAVAAVRHALDAQQQELVVYIPDEPLWLRVDPVRLVQVLDNLLANASKYTDRGGRVELVVTLEDEQVVVSVRDNGMGIDAELLPRVFDLFTQASTALDRSRGGLGIGLTLVRNLVSMQGGSVAAYSEGPGKGSQFTVRLPAAEPPATPDGEASTPPTVVPPRRVLIVDDNLEATTTLTMLLEQVGHHQVRICHNGQSALTLAEQFRPDVILLDIGLPGLDGFEVARKLRHELCYEGVLAAVTGYGQEDDRRKSAEVGFDEHLIKPPHYDAIVRLFSHPRLATISAAEGDAESGQ